MSRCAPPPRCSSSTHVSQLVLGPDGLFSRKLDTIPRPPSTTPVPTKSVQNGGKKWETASTDLVAQLHLFYFDDCEEYAWAFSDHSVEWTTVEARAAGGGRWYAWRTKDGVRYAALDPLHLMKCLSALFGRDKDSHGRAYDHDTFNATM